MTPLDDAHARMEAASDDDQARLGFYERLAGSELFVLLEHEAQGEDITPRLFVVDEMSFALAFDRAERLAEFAGGPAPYAALSGRVLAQLLTGASLGLGVNIEVAPSAILIPPDAVEWLHRALGGKPERIEARPTEILPPGGLPDTLIMALDARLASAAGLARFAYLCEVKYETGPRSHLLAIIDPAPGSEAALSRAVGDALIFSGVEAGWLDVAFFAASDPVAARLAKVGLRFDIPQPAKPPEPRAPGSDPDAPPKLR